MEENYIIEEIYCLENDVPLWCNENNFTFYYNGLNKIMITFFIFLSGFGIAFSIVGLFIIDPLIKKDFKIIKKLEEDELVKKKEYEFLDNNINDFEDLSMNNLSDSYNEEFIEINTPKGLVYMNYDKTLELFNYYCNSKEIPYNYLESVARLFVIKYNCKNIYSTETVEKSEFEKSELEKSKVEKNNIFVKFKSYNVKKELIDDKNNIKCNCFKYKGKIIDYENYIFSKKNQQIEDYIDVDYQAFKKNN